MAFVSSSADSTASQQQQQLTEPSSASCRKIRGNRWVNFFLSIQICTLLVASASCESVKLSVADKNNVEVGFESNRSSREPRFISLDSSSGDIDIDLDLSIPFLSIPLEQSKGKHGTAGFPWPLLKLNTKALAIFGTLMAIITFVIPLLFKQLPEQPPNIYNQYPSYGKEHKRSDRSLDFSSYLEDSLNEILGKNSNLAPCIERLVCSAVATAKRADEPTSFDKIIDTLSSHSLFEEAVNGTVIKEAAAKGRQVLSAEDCVTIYPECAFNQKILLNILKMIGL